MTELETLRAEHKALGERIAALEAAPKPWPQVGSTYWCLTLTGEITDMSWNDDEFDAGRVSIGNVFRTEQEAIDERDRRKVAAIMREMADGGAATADWMIGFDVQFNSIKVFSVSRVNRVLSFCEMMFPTQLDAQACLDRIVEMLSENGTRDGMARLLELWGGK